jgi:hypothetical protein
MPPHTHIPNAKKAHAKVGVKVYTDLVFSSWVPSVQFTVHTHTPHT